MDDKDTEYYMWKMIHDTIERLMWEQKTNSVTYLLGLIEHDILDPYEEKRGLKKKSK